MGGVSIFRACAEDIAALVHEQLHHESLHTRRSDRDIGQVP